MLEELVAAGGALRKRPVREVIQSIAKIGQRWRNPSDPIRVEAAAILPEEFRFSRKGLDWGLELIFGDWTVDQLTDLLIDEVGNPAILDGFADKDDQTMAHARGPRLLVQVLAGNTPASMAHAMLLGMLAKAPQVIKSPSSQPNFPMLLRKSIAEVDPILGAAIAVGTWNDKREHLYKLVDRADVVVVYGSDETVQQLRLECSPKTRYVAYGHAVSLVVITREAATEETMNHLAWDMLTYDQRGCLSPRAALVEAGGALEPFEFAEIFATKVLPSIASQMPCGPLYPGEAEMLLQRRGVYAFRGRSFSGDGWTVTYDEHPAWPDEALPRFLPIKTFSDADDLRKIVAPVAQHLLAVGYAGPRSRQREFAELLGETSASRVCPVGHMQCPPVNWSISGRTPFRDLLSWCKLERGDQRSDLEL